MGVNIKYKTIILEGIVGENFHVLGIIKEFLDLMLNTQFW